MVRGIKKTRNMQEPMQKHWKEDLGRKPLFQQPSWTHIGEMSNATSNSKGHTNLIPHCNAELRWLHLRTGQELSHKSVFPSRLPHSLFVSVISWKTALWALEWQGNAPSTLLPQWELSVPTAEPLPAPTSDPFWGNSEKMKMGRHFKALSRTSHTSHARGALSPSPFMGPSPDPLTSTVTPHSQRNWLKEEELDLFWNHSPAVASEPSNTHLPHLSPAPC